MKNHRKNTMKHIDNFRGILDEYHFMFNKENISLKEQSELANRLLNELQKELSKLDTSAFYLSNDYVNNISDHTIKLTPLK